jgi:uncharacterized protein (TIGR02597 family)
MKTKHRIIACTFAAALTAGWPAISAGESVSYTPPAGYFALPVKARSDNYVSLPLVPKAVGFGTVSAAGRDRVTIGSKRWNSGQFRRKAGAPKPSFVAEFVTGPLRGISYEVLDNNTDTLVLDTQGDDLTNHPRGSISFGDVVRLRPLWTAAAVFGDSEANLQIAPKPNPLRSGDSIILPNNSGVGYNKAPDAQLSFVRNAGWRSSTGDQSIDRADYPFIPGQPMNIRRLATQDTAIITLGHVTRGRQAVYIPDGAAAGNDVFVGLLRPETVSLEDSGLIDVDRPELSAFQASENAVFRADELMSFGSDSGLNQTPQRSFYYLASRGWREAGSPGIEVGRSITLEPGRAYLLRKKASSPGGDWVQMEEQAP